MIDLTRLSEGVPQDADAVGSGSTLQAFLNTTRDLLDRVGRLEAAVGRLKDAAAARPPVDQVLYRRGQP